MNKRKFCEPIPVSDEFKNRVKKELDPNTIIRENRIDFEKMGKKVRAKFYLNQKSGGFGMETEISADNVQELENKVINFIS